MTTCRGCGRRWTGHPQCHCATCHRHFSAIGAFDAHRTGPDHDRRCGDPATLTTKTGRPKLAAAHTALGTVWGTWNPNPHPNAAQRTPPPTAIPIPAETDQ
jgi:hypothetical protein